MIENITHQIIGFFIARGAIHHGRYPQIRITVTPEKRPALEHFQREFGGHIYPHRTKRGNSLMLQISKREDVKHFLKTLIDIAVLPSEKVADARQVLDNLT